MIGRLVSGTILAPHRSVIPSKLSVQVTAQEQYLVPASTAAPVTTIALRYTFTELLSPLLPVLTLVLLLQAGEAMVVQGGDPVM